MARILCIGEAMLELSREGEHWALGFGGDTLNTSIHLSRCGHDVSYFTALGDDPFSRDLRESWRREGIDCSLVLTHPTRRPGLYAIATDGEGERSFTYWRDMSAAREMFSLPGSEQTIARRPEFELLFFSLVSLAIISEPDRDALLSMAAKARDGGALIAFDANYRPALWQSCEEAAAVRDAAIAIADIGLPSFDDEAALSGATSAAAIAERWRSLGCREVLVKLGAEGCLLPIGDLLAPAAQLSPLDSSGAGDAFNAGYLSARLEGQAPLRSAEWGQALAGWTIMRRGAIPPRDSEYPAFTD